MLSKAENLDAELRKLCKTQFLTNAQLLNEYSPPQTLTGEFTRLVFLRSIEPYIAPNGEQVPSWLSDRSDPDSITTGWNTTSYGHLIKTLDIPGHHFEVFNRQNVSTVQTCYIIDGT